MSVWNSQKFVPWAHAATLLEVSNVCVQKALCCLPQEGDAKVSSFLFFGISKFVFCFIKALLAACF